MDEVVHIDEQWNGFYKITNSHAGLIQPVEQTLVLKLNDSEYAKAILQCRK